MSTVDNVTIDLAQMRREAEEAAKRTGTPKQRYEVKGYAEISPENIERHPKNPRPTFHLKDDDPGLIALGDSLKTEGQHRPCVVYELVGHWDPEVKDQPGKYRLYQGERRWRASKLAKVDKVRCFVVATPKSEAEEWDWLGVEEAFKQDWQPFFVLRYAHQLAQQHGIPVYSTEISAKTGIPMADLKVAEKLFKLDPAIQLFAAEYEELMYEQLVRGKRKRGQRLNGTGVRSKEFPVNKAAIVWDIFEAMRTNCPKLVSDYSDVELQRMIASKATQNATIEDLQKLHGQIRQLGKNPPPGLLTEIAELLQNETRTVRDTVKATGAEEVTKLNLFMQRSNSLRKLAVSMVGVADQLGNDIDGIEQVQREALDLLRDVSELERSLSKKVTDLLKAMR